MITNKSTDPFSWLTNNSSMINLIRERDWTTTSLGSPDKWDLSFKTLINLCLDSKYPSFVWLGPDLISLYNDSYAEIVGPIKHPQLFGAKARELWPEIWDTIKVFIDEVFKGDVISHTDLQLFIERNGRLEESYFSFCYTPIRNDLGIIQGVYCTCQETTQQVLSRKQLDLARLETENAHNQLNDFFMQAPAPMVIMLGPEHHFWLANPLYEELIGRKAAGKNLMDIFSHEEVTPFIPLLDKVYSTGVPFIGNEVPFHHEKDGVIQKKFLNFGYYPFREADGRVKGILAIVNDVTNQAYLRMQIEANRNELHMLSESIPQIVWTAKPTGELDYTNSRWTEYSGSSDPSKWLSFVHPDDIERITQVWLNCVDSGDDYEAEFRLRKFDGTYHAYLVRASALRHARGEILKWYGTCTDIEAQKITVSQLENEKILREQFVSMLTHDLRSPLSAAKISAQYMQRYPSSPDKIASLSGRIIDSLNRADKMIENLLDANRIKAGERLPLKIEKVDLISLVNHSLIDLATIHGDRFKLITPHDQVEGHWSYDGLLRILENLCTNAVKFGRDHSPITVALYDNVGVVSLSVHNYGIPISLEEQKKLFDPYQRLNRMDKNAVVGWGLGLTLVKGLAESHGGSVSVTSSELEGTTFTIIVPKDSSQIIKY